ncbi:hypothetical protein BN2537_4099 [Streptomyces venezuelae]|nr:hypothetical protein BN2537_4099 [Streptomyces venezuelae]
MKRSLHFLATCRQGHTSSMGRRRTRLRGFHKVEWKFRTVERSSAHAGQTRTPPSPPRHRTNTP